MNRKIFKSNRNKVLTGTCGGIGEYFNIDPTLIRLIFVVTVFFGGGGIFAYIIASLIIPNQPIDDFENFDDFSNMKQANEKYSESKKSKKSKMNDDDEFDSYFKK